MDDYFGEDLPDEYYEEREWLDTREWDDWGSTIEAAAIDAELMARAHTWAQRTRRELAA